MTRERAARTAADSLAAIEAWTRRTFYAGLATAACAAFLALVAAGAVLKYYQATQAISQAQTQLTHDLERMRQIRPGSAPAAAADRGQVHSSLR